MDRRSFAFGAAALAAGAGRALAQAPQLPAPSTPPSISGLRRVGYLDIPGGGQVTFDRGRVFIGHVFGPRSTSLVDVRDPRNPRLLSEIGGLPPGAHSHKVRVRGDLMFTNVETAVYTGRFDPDFIGGIRVFDIADPTRPREIHYWKAGGAGVVGCGVHRFTIDDRYVYASPTQDGYDGNICMILDFQDPIRPREVGRWHVPGQHTAAGEKIAWEPRDARCHHPIRVGDRLYVSWWHAGGFILDISDMARPKFVGRFDPGNAFAYPTHTFLPLRQPVKGRRYAFMTDECAQPLRPAPPANCWMLDITDETHPTPVDTFQVAAIDTGQAMAPNTGSHQPAENYTGTEIPVAYFAQGLRILDVSDPREMKEVAHYVYEAPQGLPRIASNDVTMGGDGLIYLIDRNRGLHILERA